jgi:hypothetical protein
MTSSPEKISFLILAHADPAHLSRLCRALGLDDDIFVHVDGRTPLSAFESRRFPGNVKFARRRIPVFWSDISVVEATLMLLEEAMREKTRYLRIVLLSGSCYPIKKIERLRDYFATADHFDMAYMSMLDFPELNWRISRYRFRQPWIPAIRKVRKADPYLTFLDKAARKLISTALRPKDRAFGKKFPGLVPYFGSQFWSVTADCASMMLQFVRVRPEFLNYHRYSWAPDEHFFHTIVGNSEFSASGGGPVPHGGNINNLHTDRHPVVTMDHLEGILACDRFFTRKAASGQSDTLLDFLDKQVLGI